MVILFGTRLFGRVDRVPGALCVATQFFHIMLIPLLPTGSFIVASDGRATPAEGISWKSVAVAWLKPLALLVAVVVAMVLLVNGSQFGVRDLLTACVVEAVAIAAFIVPGRIKPSYQRACELGRQVELTSQQQVALERAYGRRSGKPIA